MINPIITNYRQTGITDIVFFDMYSSFRLSMIEMGSQINPFTVMLSIFENKNEFLFGKTILLPTFAILNLNVLYSTQEYLVSEFNFDYLLVNKGHEGRAFSMIAEFYFNFGIYLSSYFLYSLGNILSRIERKEMTYVRFVLYGQFMLLLLHWVRNSIMFNSIIIIFQLIVFSLISIIIHITRGNKYGK